MSEAPTLPLSRCELALAEAGELIAQGPLGDGGWRSSTGSTWPS
jgi:hypothetical protein